MTGFNLSRRLTLRGYRYFWNFEAENGQIVFQGHTRGYSRRIDALNGIEIARNSSSAEIWENGEIVFPESAYRCGLPDVVRELGAEGFQAVLEEEERRS